VKRLSFWLGLAVPVALLVVIFASVDVPTVVGALRGAEPLRVGAAFALAFLIPLLLLAWRWRWLLRRLYGIDADYRFILEEYWIALFVGYWVPGGIGSDVYRAVHVGKRAGGIPANVAVIVGERFWALLVYGALVLLTYPLVATSLDARPPVKQAVLRIGALAVLGGIALVVALLLKDSLGARLRSAIRGKLMDRLSAMARALLRAASGGDQSVTFSTILAPLFQWRNQASGLGLMIAIQAITSVGGRQLLLALGVDLPLVVHVFVWALMNFFFLLPVSVGGFGVREASFILLFGLFGVSRETSLAASFLCLFCTLAVILPGGLLWLGRGFGRRAAPPEEPGPEA
jgi:uncharacterized membrane protein YbhN (UPF0104 family)